MWTGGIEGDVLFHGLLTLAMLNLQLVSGFTACTSAAASMDTSLLGERDKVLTGSGVAFPEDCCSALESLLLRFITDTSLNL